MEDRAVELEYREKRFFCPDCKSPITRPMKKCHMCKIHFVRFATAHHWHGPSEEHEIMRIMSTDRPHECKSPISDKDTRITEDLTCSECGGLIGRPTPKCPTCKRHIVTFGKTQETITRLGISPAPGARSMLLHMAGIIGDDELKTSDTPSTASKLITGIDTDKLDTIKGMAEAGGESANEWIRRQMYRPCRPDVITMAAALGMTPDEFINRAVDQALRGGITV